MATVPRTRTRFDVGGILLDQPFKIRRLGHFGFDLSNLQDGVRFYTELLGFRISDERELGRRLPDGTAVAGGETNAYFTRHNTDHHTLVLFHSKAREAMGRTAPGVTINQITWQVGSLREIGDAIRWFEREGVRLVRSGRDMPGSNWHTYLLDPDGHTNELYYGIEQIGWDGLSKPLPMSERGFQQAPELPQMSELDEVQDALGKGVDVHSGYRYVEKVPSTYDVDGILLPRPFKVTRIGPVRLFVQDLDASVAFYRDRLGFIVTEEVGWQGHRCVLMRNNTEHHSLGLYPIDLREALGLSDHTTSFALGLQVANYRQLRDAIAFLADRGVRVRQLPGELFPGIDYSAFVFDPEGHALQLYYGMEQIGWDARPRPAGRWRRVEPAFAQWPETLEALPDTYMGEPFLGPWG